MLQFLRVQDVASFPDEVRGTLATAIVPVDGAAWITVRPSHWTQVFEEEWIANKGAQHARASIGFAVSKDRPELLDGLWQLKPGRYIVLEHDLNKQVRVMGTPEEPAMLTFPKNAHGRTANSGDRNGYEGFVVVARRSPCPFYLADPPSATPNVCPTLAQLIADEDWAAIEALLSEVQLEDAEASLGGGACPTLCELLDEAIILGGGGGELVLTIGAQSGVMPVIGTWNGKDQYYEVYWAGGAYDLDCYWTGTEWYLTNGVGEWTSSEDVATPDLVTTWTGDTPLPTIEATGGGDASAVTDCLSPEQEAVLAAALGASGEDGSFRTTDGATEIAAVPPGANVNAPQSKIRYKDAANADQELAASDTLFDGTHMKPTTQIPRRALRNSAGTGYGFVATEDLFNDTVPTAPDVTYQRVDSASATIGSAVAVPAGNSVNVTCPDATYQRKDSGGANIGSPTAIVSNGTANVTCPDGTVTVKNLNGTTLGSQAVVSNGAANYTAPIPLKFALAAGDADSYTWTVTDDEAGTYATYTQDGGSGTLTYSKNGGAFAALSGSISLAVSDTIVVRRTTSTSNGWIKWAP